MKAGPDISVVASLVVDPARANMLTALLSGRALTASELAQEAGITPQTASSHLAKLEAGGLIEAEKQGRHRYYRLSRAEVAEAVEALMAVAAVGPKRYRPTGPKDDAMRLARTCYDHLAGRLGVAMADALCGGGHVVLSEGVGLVTETGERFLASFGIDFGAPAKAKRPLCRCCIDWSERRPHLAGRLGAALLDRTLALNWIGRVSNSRTMKITAAGERGFAATFGISVEKLRDIAAA